MPFRLSCSLKYTEVEGGRFANIYDLMRSFKFMGLVRSTFFVPVHTQVKKSELKKNLVTLKINIRSYVNRIYVY